MRIPLALGAALPLLLLAPLAAQASAPEQAPTTKPPEAPAAEEKPAEPAPPSADEAARERLKAELKQELTEEIKAQLRQELQAEGGAAPEAPKEDAWASEEWKWEEPVKPALNFFELDGYFRFRYQFFKDLDLGTYYKNTQTGVQYGPFSPGYAPPTPLCNTDLGTQRRTATQVGSNSCGNAIDASSLGGANMRLRLEPILNVSEDIKIKMQIDVLDNLVLGSTPEAFPLSDSVPLSAFTQTQIPPSDGVNALFDSIRVKRVWAEVMTPLGQLRVGRMPSHFGMGLLANEGQGIDSDYGDSNDRIMFATKIADHYIVPAFDWTVSGPTSALRTNPQGQPFDRDQRDDVDQYILAIARRDTPQEIKDKLEADSAVINYGTYQVLRFQALDAASYFKDQNPNAGPGATDLVKRDAWAWAFSFWFKLQFRKLLLEAEYAGVIGAIGNSAVAGTYSSTDRKIDIALHGAAFRGEYKLLHDALTLHLLVAMASGDRTPGWGVRPLTDTAPAAGSWDGAQQSDDGKINNFRFDPDFRVDLILWRELVGMVTDAVVVRPGIQYNITEGLGGRLDIVYSRAWFASSTPSGVFVDGLTSGRSPDNNLGVEFDAKIFYASDDGFHAWLQYGLLVPLAGLDSRVDAENSTRLVLDSSIAQTIQAHLAITF